MRECSAVWKGKVQSAWPCVDELILSCTGVRGVQPDILGAAAELLLRRHGHHVGESIVEVVRYACCYSTPSTRNPWTKTDWTGVFGWILLNDATTDSYRPVKTSILVQY